ncbi:hypothetical protein [Paraburkholderia sp. BR13444]|uniref:hypothetical protein n=1 Tax=Paraburkholderia sp. BR13444 TaxID=3236997 RepID=UPI0034CF0D65
MLRRIRVAQSCTGAGVEFRERQDAFAIAARRIERETLGERLRGAQRFIVGLENVRR